jgi:hypothetical protein
VTCLPLSLLSVPSHILPPLRFLIKGLRKLLDRCLHRPLQTNRTRLTLITVLNQDTIKFGRVQTEQVYSELVESLASLAALSVMLRDGSDD